MQSCCSDKEEGRQAREVTIHMPFMQAVKGEAAAIYSSGKVMEAAKKGNMFEDLKEGVGS